MITLPHKRNKRQPPESYRQRDYRRLIDSELQAERIVVQDTDLTIYSSTSLSNSAKESIIVHRGYIENYIRRNPNFATTLEPIPDDPLSPAVVRDMLLAGQRAGVGPMAAVAGAMAAKVGHDVLTQTEQVIVENGGDVFIHTTGAITIGVFAGPSPLSLKIGIRLKAGDQPLGVCTSSASVGHSLSLGRADAACVLSDSCALADAVATALANRITRTRDIQPSIDWAKTINGVEGILVLLGSNMGAWGAITVVPI